MIAIGTGMFAGLSSVTQWRFASNDASLALTNMYDIRARPSGDGFLPQGALEAIAEGIDGVEAAEERLISQTQVEVDTGDGSIFVPGRIIGVDMSDGGPSVNGVETIVGRAIEEGEIGEPVVLIERTSAASTTSFRMRAGCVLERHHRPVRRARRIPPNIPDSRGRRLLRSGELGRRVHVPGDRAGAVRQARAGQRPGAHRRARDRPERRGDGAACRDGGAPPRNRPRPVRTEDDASYLALTRDPEGDQQFYNVFALALFAGAAFASLNFAARMVETQRREIGTSMALGVNPVAIAVRPLLVGIQIAVWG